MDAHFPSARSGKGSTGQINLGGIGPRHIRVPGYWPRGAQRSAIVGGHIRTQVAFLRVLVATEVVAVAIGIDETDQDVRHPIPIAACRRKGHGQLKYAKPSDGTGLHEPDLGLRSRKVHITLVGVTAAPDHRIDDLTAGSVVHKGIRVIVHIVIRIRATTATGIIPAANAARVILETGTIINGGEVIVAASLKVGATRNDASRTDADEIEGGIIRHTGTDGVAIPNLKGPIPIPVQLHHGEVKGCRVVSTVNLPPIERPFRVRSGVLTT